MSSKNSIVSIHNPTLRFLDKWLAMVVHPRADLRLCSLLELQCLYAMATKIRFSPVRSILAHWQKIISGKSSIDITSLVTRVARYVKAMAGAEVTFLPETEAYSVRPGAAGLLIGIECSRVRDSSWMYLTSIETTRIGVALAAVLVCHGEANLLLSSQNHARSLAKDDLRQKPHRHDLSGHSHCEVCQSDGWRRSHLFA